MNKHWKTGIAMAFSCLLPSCAVAADVLNAHEAPILVKAREGSASEIEGLLKIDARSRDARSDLGSSPLHLAAMNPDTGPLRVLLAAGANPNARDQNGATPLHMAAYASRPVHTRMLLEAGADPLLKTNEGRDAAAMARKVKADETAGIISLWILKACKAGKPC